jgi:PAS domain S-box-containing protein
MDDIAAEIRFPGQIIVATPRSRYQRFFETSRDILFFLSPEGKIRQVNQAAVEKLGYAGEDALLSLPSVVVLFDNPLHWKAFRLQIERQGYVEDFDVVLKKTDGSLVHCLCSGSAVKNAKGQVLGYQGIAKDVTARMDSIRNLRKRYQELSLLHSVGLAMHASQDLKGILSTALVRVLKVLKIDSGAIFLIDKKNSRFVLTMQHGLPLNGGDDPEVVFHDSPLGESFLRGGTPVRPSPTFPYFKITVKDPAGGWSRVLSCFLIIAREAPTGFIGLDIADREKLTDLDLSLLGSLGNFLGGAVQSAELLESTVRQREELRSLAAMLFQSQEYERKKIARELHDESGQVLTGASFTLDIIEKKLSPGQTEIMELVDTLRNQIGRLQRGIRNLSSSLHPVVLSTLGLEPALEQYLSEVSRYCNLQIRFKMVGFTSRVDPALELALYRISQEALTNTLKYAKATRFDLSIVKGYPQIIFQAKDDGIGFDYTEVVARQVLGIVSMKERAAMLGGTFSLHSGQGKGTHIRIEIPVDGVREKDGNQDSGRG